MRRRLRTTITPRRRVFLGCEGASEASYGAWLARIDDERSRKLHIDNVDLGGGDPLAIVEAALRQISNRESRRGAYEVKALLLDTDKLAVSPARSARAHALILRHGLLPIWQTPCHEAFLLRHLLNCETLRPATAIDSIRELSIRWKGYKRPVAAIRLAERLTYQSLQRALRVESDLAAFIARVGL